MLMNSRDGALKPARFQGRRYENVCVVTRLSDVTTLRSFRGVLLSILLIIRDYVRLAAPEPEVLRLIGEESVRNGTDKLS